MSRAKEQPATLPDLAREVGLTFPASARLIGVHREAGLDDAVMLKVEIAAGDLPAFTKTCPVPAEVFAPGTRGLLGPDVGFWDPHLAANLRTGHTITANHSTLNVGIADGSEVSSCSTSSITGPEIRVPHLAVPYGEPLSSLPMQVVRAS